jgi:hypothetical protein
MSGRRCCEDGNALDEYCVQRRIYNDEDFIGVSEGPIEVSLGWNLLSGQRINDVAAGPNRWLSCYRGANFACLPFLSQPEEPSQTLRSWRLFDLRFGGHDRIGDVQPACPCPFIDAPIRSEHGPNKYGRNRLISFWLILIVTFQKLVSQADF